MTRKTLASVSTSLKDSVATADTNSGMGIAAADYDNNNSPDIFITNMGHQNHSVYQNQPNTAFINVTQSSFGVPDFGVNWTGWGTSWADFDLDTDLDLFVSHGAIPVVNLDADRQYAHLYTNQTAQNRSGHFIESTVSGLANGEPTIGRGSAVADYDNDGDLDIAQSSINGDLILYRNDTEQGNWFLIQFAQPQPGTIAIITLHDGNQLRREILAGSSYLSADAQRIHFGLGGHTEIAALKIVYPNGTTLQKGGLLANQILAIK